jgi:hypothetical protein
MSYLGIDTSTFRSLGIQIPQNRVVSFLAVLGFWTASLVFTIAAWTQAKAVGEPQGEGGDFDENVDKAKNFITMSSLSQLFFLLGFFFLLRCSLSPL